MFVTQSNVRLVSQNIKIFSELMYQNTKSKEDISLP